MDRWPFFSDSVLKEREALIQHTKLAQGLEGHQRVLAECEISFVDRQWTKVKQRNKGTRHRPSFPLLVLLMISLFLQLSEQNTLFVLLASKHCSQIPPAMGQMKTQICQIGAKWASAPPYTKHSPAVGAIDKRYQPPRYIIILIHISPQIFEHKLSLKKAAPRWPLHLRRYIQESSQATLPPCVQPSIATWFPTIGCRIVSSWTHLPFHLPWVPTCRANLHGQCIHFSRKLLLTTLRPTIGCRWNLQIFYLSVYLPEYLVQFEFTRKFVCSMFVNIFQWLW